MNIYRCSFEAMCPSDGDRIRYTLEILTPEIIKAEDIGQAIFELTEQPAFHEDMADKIGRLFPGRQTVVAVHRGVEITTIRGASPKSAQN